MKRPLIALFLIASLVTTALASSLVYNPFTHKLDFTSSGGSGGTGTASIALPVAVCQGTTATSGFNLPANNLPTALCVTGTNTNFAELNFGAGVQQSVQYQIAVPYNADCTQAFNLQLKWRAVAITNSVTWGVQSVFVADGATVDPSFNTASTVSHAPQGTTLQVRTDTIAGFTKTGCAIGSMMFLKIYRDSGDTMTGNAELLEAQLQYTRTN